MVYSHSERGETASESGVLNPTRRRILQIAAAGGGLAIAGVPTSAQATTFELGGNTAGWEGRAPESIAGTTNPTLELQAGQTYVVEWENVDGLPHNFVIEDAEGTDVVRSEIISEMGATQTVEFEATEAMAEYYCEVHPQSMRGEISIGTAPDDGNGEAPPAETPPFFEHGTEVGASRVVEGLTAPTDFAMDAYNRMFVADQTGELWIVPGGGGGPRQVSGALAIDLSDRMVTLGEFAGSYADPEQEYDERGLLGVELHSEFLDNDRLFLHYSAPPNEETPEGWSHVETVSEFSMGDGPTVDPDSEQILMEFQKPQYNHDSGPMAFGQDGYLYVPMGDGGGANDDMYGHVEDWYDENEGGNGQDTSENLLGGIHRIDVENDGDDRPYAIPDDNPLVDVEGQRDEYYSWGWRNPFGITVDAEGRMIVADAGQNRFEEANVLEAGGNYGWNVKEGTHCFSTADPGQSPESCPTQVDDSIPDPRGGEELIDPVVEYPHNYQGMPVGIVIVGGHIYEADAIGDLQNAYVFGDWTRDVARQAPDGRLLAAWPGVTGADGATQDSNQTDGDGAGQAVPREELWAMEELMIAGGENGNLHRFVRQFGRGRNGELFVLVNQRGVPEGDTGAVLKLVPPGEGDEFQAPELPEGEGEA